MPSNYDDAPDFLKPVLDPDPDVLTACDGSCGHGIHALVYGGPEGQLCSYNRGLAAGLKAAFEERSHA